MNRLKALRNRRAVIAAKMRAILDSAGDDVLSAEAQAEYEPLDAEIARINDNIRQEEDDLERVRSMAGSGPRESAGIMGTLDALPAPTGRTYATLFPGSARSNDGWQSPAEFFRVLGHRQADARLASGMSGVVGADGGFLVPSSIAAGVIDNMLEESVVLPHARVVGMETAEQRFPTFDNSTTASGTILGGLTATWTAEGDSITPKKPALRTVKLAAKKLAILIPATNELLADAPGFQGALEQAMRDGANWFVDRSLIVGNGVGELAGILSASSLISVAKETLQTAGTFVYENAIAMWGRLAPQCASNARWLVHPTVLPQLLQLNLPLGLGGSPVPVLRDTDGRMTLLTRPIDISEKCQPLGTKGDVILYDPSQLLVGIHKQVTIESSAHAYFTSDEMAFRLTLRLDAMPTWSAAHTMPDGSNTVSWAVVCDTRA